MGTIIDVVGSRIAGTVILLLIISSIFAGNSMNHNVRTLLNLNTAANQIAEVIDMAFLEKVGQNATSADEVIPMATSDELVIRTVNPNAIVWLKMNTKDGNHYLSITRNGKEEYNTTPYYFESKDIFTYLDKDNNEVVPTATNLDTIYGVKVDIVLIAPSMGKGEAPIRYPLTFWRNFKGVYLKDSIDTA